MNDVFKDINGIIGKIEPSFWEANWWWLMLLALALAALAGFIFARLNKKPKLTPYQIALIRLDASTNAEDDKLYAYAISSLVRDYISAIFDLPAPERTTEEFLTIAGNSEKLSEDQREKIAQILLLSDKAKFAGAQFGKDERALMLNFASSFIEEDNAKRKAAKK